MKGIESHDVIKKDFEENVLHINIKYNKSLCQKIEDYYKKDGTFYYKNKKNK